MQVILKLGKEFIIMNENNNMNNNYTNNPAPEQPAGDNMYQETTSQPQDQNTYQQAPAQDARQHVPL